MGEVDLGADVLDDCEQWGDEGGEFLSGLEEIWGGDASAEFCGIFEGFKF